MTNKQKKEYLSQYIEIVREMQLHKDNRGRLYTIPAQRLSALPKGSRIINDNLAEEVCNVINLEEDYIKIELEELGKLKMKIFNCIRTLKDSKYRQIMYSRYIYGFRWEEICIKMNYEWTWIHSLHGKALKEIEIVETEEHKIAQ